MAVPLARAGALLADDDVKKSGGLMLMVEWLLRRREIPASE